MAGDAEHDAAIDNVIAYIETCGYLLDHDEGIATNGQKLM